MSDDRTKNMIGPRRERDRHVLRERWQDVHRQLLLDPIAADFEVVGTVTIIHDVERLGPGRECSRHVNVVIVLTDLYPRAVGSLRISGAVRGVLGGHAAGAEEEAQSAHWR